MKFVTTDSTRWGTGTGVVQQPVDIDLNFWELQSKLNNLIANVPAGVGIATITKNSDGSLTFNMTDGTSIGPIAFPTAEFHDRGDWAALTFYENLDIVSQPGVGLYKVNLNHVSAATFDPNAVDSSSNPLYQLLFAFAPAANVVYDMGFFYGGVLKDLTYDRIWEEPVTRKLLLPVTPAPNSFHRAHLRTAASTNAQDFNLYQGSTVIGTVHFAIGANEGVVTISTDVNLTADVDMIGLGLQAVNDAVAAGLSIKLAVQQVLG